MLNETGITRILNDLNSISHQAHGVRTNIEAMFNRAFSNEFKRSIAENLHQDMKQLCLDLTDFLVGMGADMTFEAVTRQAPEQGGKPTT